MVQTKDPDSPLVFELDPKTVHVVEQIMNVLKYKECHRCGEKTSLLISKDDNTIGYCSITCVISCMKDKGCVDISVPAQYFYDGKGEDQVDGQAVTFKPAFGTPDIDEIPGMKRVTFNENEEVFAELDSKLMDMENAVEFEENLELLENGEELEETLESLENAEELEETPESLDTSQDTVVEVLQSAPAALAQAAENLPRAPATIQAAVEKLPQAPVPIQAAVEKLPRPPAANQAAFEKLPRAPATIQAAVEKLPRAPVPIHAAVEKLPRAPVPINASVEKLPHAPATIQAAVEKLPTAIPPTQVPAGNLPSAPAAASPADIVKAFPEPAAGTNPSAPSFMPSFNLNRKPFDGSVSPVPHLHSESMGKLNVLPHTNSGLAVLKKKEAPETYVPFGAKELQIAQTAPANVTTESFSSAPTGPGNATAESHSHTSAEKKDSPPAKPNQRKIYMLDDLEITPAITQNGQGFISYVYSGGRHHVCPLDGDPAQLLQNTIADAVAKNTLKKLEGQVPIVGEVLLGNYRGGEYYRGVITKVDETTGEVKLEFVDYGDTATTKIDELFVPTEEMMKEPLYGLVFTLFGVPEDTPITDRVSKLFDDTVTLSFQGDEIKYKSTGLLSTASGDCLNFKIQESVQ